MFRALVGLVGVGLSAATLQAARSSVTSPQASSHAGFTQQPAGAAAPPSAPQRVLLDKYCVTCHNQRLKTAGLTLDKLDVGVFD